MRYYLDCEFNGKGGDLISLAMIREDGWSLYAVVTDALSDPANGTLHDNITPWVMTNVIPILKACPVKPEAVLEDALPRVIERFLSNDPSPHVVTDWPEDMAYFARAIINGPGTMINIPRLIMELIRVDAYPTDIPNAVQHNAWWDALALRYRLTRRSDFV